MPVDWIFNSPRIAVKIAWQLLVSRFTNEVKKN